MEINNNYIFKDNKLDEGEITSLLDNLDLLSNEEKTEYLSDFLNNLKSFPKLKEIFSDFLEKKFKEKSFGIVDKQNLEIFRIYLFLKQKSNDLNLSGGLTLNDIKEFSKVSIEKKEEVKINNGNIEVKKLSTKITETSMYENGLIDLKDIRKVIEDYKTAEEFKDFYDKLGKTSKTAFSERLYRYLTGSGTSIYSPIKSEVEETVKILQMIQIIEGTGDNLDGVLTQKIKDNFFDFRERFGENYNLYVSGEKREEKYEEYLEKNTHIEDIKKFRISVIKSYYKFINSNNIESINKKIIISLITNKIDNYINFFGNKIDLNGDGKLEKSDIKFIIQDIMLDFNIDNKETKKLVNNFFEYIINQDYKNESFSYLRISNYGIPLNYTSIYNYTPNTSLEDKSEILKKYYKSNILATSHLNNNTDIQILKEEVLTFLKGKRKDGETHIYFLKGLTGNENLNIYNLSPKDAGIISVYISSYENKYSFETMVGNSEYGYKCFLELQKSEYRLTGEKLKSFYLDIITSSLSYISKGNLYNTDNQNSMSKKIYDSIKGEVTFNKIISYFNENFNVNILDAYYAYWKDSNYKKNMNIDNLGSHELIKLKRGVCRHMSFLSENIFESLKLLQPENKNMLKNSALYSKNTITKSQNERISQYDGMIVGHSWNNLVTVGSNDELYISQLDYQGESPLDITFKYLYQETIVQSGTNEEELGESYENNITVFNNNEDLEKMVLKFIEGYLIGISKYKEKEKYQKIMDILSYTPYTKHTEIRKIFLKHFIINKIFDNTNRIMIDKILGKTENSSEGKLLKIWGLYNYDFRLAYKIFINDNELISSSKKFKKTLDKRIIEIEQIVQEINLLKQRKEKTKHLENNFKKIKEDILYEIGIGAILPSGFDLEGLWDFFYSIYENNMDFINILNFSNQQLREIGKNDRKNAEISQYFLGSIRHGMFTGDINFAREILKGYGINNEVGSILNIYLLILEKKDRKIIDFLKSDIPGVKELTKNLKNSDNPEKYLKSKLFGIGGVLYDYGILNILKIHNRVVKK